MSGAAAPLFSPLKVGRMNLKQRVVLAPLTRFRADENHTHTDLAVKYYDQRSSTPGTLLITEATFIAARAGLYKQAPGIWSKEQIAAWRKVTDKVHANGSYIYVQLWALGRVADPQLLKDTTGADVVSASDIPVAEGATKPRPLTVEEIKEFISAYEAAARNALEAGFDGVELHAANGYLPDQFLQDLSNNRTDAYGGSIENRARFILEVIEKLVSVVGQDRVGIRLSPWSIYQNMGMKDPVPQFSYVVEQLAQKHPHLAYIHAVESRVDGSDDTAKLRAHAQLDFIRKIWGDDKVLMRAGGYDRDSALKITEAEPNTLVAVGRYFTSNPDLPRRWKQNVALEPYNRAVFYAQGQAEGYADYKMVTEVEA
ncbi:NADH:flavin oxidoreductase/NADH oxidase [Xylona heveae TC161]|uniref:NADH:flavin oxidoreductase/NADH oxidase n=1 Tax=Xylona heveae (strain CBS 132557 / TC161) TaxID=1328760 RepID=A0A165GBL9_XYLHT|nr:NADH:flavin oxidoreductase/NADH oxidase [Xylona heveae TC161]KZF21993.1 NADH:flavin oxidoreductase/NADH oxidase [Xylona heveae TC161]